MDSLNLARKVHILDVGGMPFFWEQMHFDKREDVDITVLNLKEVVDQQDKSYKNIRCVVGDARNMSQFKDHEFDIAFSNSVIEHVGDFQDQIQMANEIQRVGKSIFLQTPNYFFPLEPHFLTFGFQFLPIKARAKLLQKCDLGWYKRTPDHDLALQVAMSIRLLRKVELKKLFPRATIYSEKFCGLTKSFIVVQP